MLIVYFYEVQLIIIMQPFREKLAVTEILGRNSLQEDYQDIKTSREPKNPTYKGSTINKK